MKRGGVLGALGAALALLLLAPPGARAVERPGPALADPMAPTPGAEAYYQFALGKMAQRRRDFAVAAAALRRAAELDPASAVVRAELAWTWLMVRDYPAAEESARAALERDGRNARAHWVMAQLHYSRARRGIEPEKNRQRAMAELEASLSGGDQDDPETLITLGQFYFEAGEFGRAVPILERYVAGQSLPSANALFLLARAQIQLERFGDAERVLRQTLLQAPESLQVIEALVDVLRLQEDYEETVPLLVRTLELQGGDATVYTRLGEAHYRAGRFKEAGDAFEMATREDPRSTTALYYLSLSLEKQARQAEARLALEKILLVEPNNPEVLFRLARMDERQGEYADAVTHYRQLVRSLARSEDAEARRDIPTFCGRVGVLLLEMKRYDEAVDELTACRANDGSGEPLLQHLLVRSLVFAGRAAPALEEAARARARYPADPRFEILEAEVLLMTGRRQEGEDKLKGLLARAPAPEHSPPPDEAPTAGKDEEDLPVPVMVSDAYFNAGTHAERNGETERAETLLRRALEIHPDNAPALNYLGYVWADAGRNLEEALEFLKRAVALDPDNAAYLDSLGWAYFRLGRLGPARENLQKAVRLLPADPTMHEHLGDVEAADGRPDDAVQNWRQALKQGAESPERIREKIRNVVGSAPNESKAR